MTRGGGMRHAETRTAQQQFLWLLDDCFSFVYLRGPCFERGLFCALLYFLLSFVAAVVSVRVLSYSSTSLCCHFYCLCFIVLFLFRIAPRIFCCLLFCFIVVCVCFFRKLLHLEFLFVFVFVVFWNGGERRREAKVVILFLLSESGNLVYIENDRVEPSLSLSL